MISVLGLPKLITQILGIKSNDAGNSGVHGFDNGVNSAILRYKGAPEAEPTKNQTDIYQNMLLETSLHVRFRSQFSWILTDINYSLLQTPKQ